MRPKVLLQKHDDSAPQDQGAAGGSRWDLLAIAALLSAGVTVGGILGLPFARRDPGYGREMVVLTLLGLVAASGTAAAASRAAVRDGLNARSAIRRLVRPWTHPSRDRLMFLFGVLISLPLLALHTSVILGDADSAKLLTAIRYVQRHGPGYLVDSQENLLPHLILGPAVALAGIGGAKAVGILSLQALCGVVSFISWKLTRSTWAAIAAVFALLSFRSIPERTWLLPMYPTMLALGFIGVYFAFEATRSEGRRRWIFAICSGLAIFLSSEAHALGVFFFGIPALLLVTTQLRKAVQGLWRVYVALAVFYLPRAALNLAHGGLRHFFSYRDDYWISKGYVSLIQKNFWHLPSSSYDVPRYVADLPSRIPRLAGWTAIAALALAVIAFLLARGRLRWFALLSFAFYTGPVVLKRVPYYPRYYSPLAVGAALCAGAGVHLLATRHLRFRKYLALPLLLVLMLTAMLNAGTTLRTVRAGQVAILAGPFQALAARIDDGKGVIGARSTYLVFVDPDVQTYGGQFLSERDYVTYLTWPSDQAVIRMLREHNIGWAIVNPKLRLENGYNNAWLLPTYGKTARHVTSLASSPNFCAVLQEGRYTLYKLGPCPPFDAG